ncbi:MAG: histidinol dehydrogenase [Rhodocyclales bacterium]|nr:histidinol dehydrogenase [Rhodocyclales bacterium]
MNKPLINRLVSSDLDFRSDLEALLAFESALDSGVQKAVNEIIADVRVRGDAAVLELTRRFDSLDANSIEALEIPQVELQAALDGLPTEQRAALETACQRVRIYHERQIQPDWEMQEANGTRLGQRITPLDRVGIYVPGGKASYPSSVLMNAMPAKVAGVREIIMVTPTPHGERNKLVLAAAALAGVDRVFAIGGAQAVAALAYGTESIPAVDKIVGPGNAYVAEAKRRVFGRVGIDMVAGPSEVLVISDASGDPDWVAMDLFAQAEHDERAQSILLCPDADYLARVEAAMARLLPTMPRVDIIRTSLAERGALIQVRDMDEACEIANYIAAEHLELSVEDPEALLPKIKHAGAIFVGHWSVEALGDYCAGPNHVLPTGRSARFSSPLGVYDFQKRTSVIRISRQGAAELAPVAATLAYGEGLQAHARSAEYRK